MAISQFVQRGFTFSFVLIALVILGIAAEIVTYSSIMERRRSQERELLYVGDAYREAIKSYYYSRAPHQYPTSISDLLYDPRFVYKRHLRRAYPDPVTEGEWNLLYDGEGRVVGVSSYSKKQPVKQGGFYPPYEQFGEAMEYRQWKFRFVPSANKTKIPANQSLSGTN